MRFGLMVLWGVVACLSSPVMAETVDLVILHVNDTHGKLDPQFRTNPATGETAEFGGIGRLATMVKNIRSENAGRTLFLHAGDVFSRGVPVTIRSGGLVNLLAYESIGVDVMTPGNGEFYFGIENLQRQASRVGFPMVHANVTYRHSGAQILPPYVIREVAGVRVGIIGLGLTRSWHHSSSGLTLHDPPETARRLAAELRPRVDLLIALTHIGVKNDSLVARAAPEIDLIVGGDSHTRLGRPSRIPRPDGNGNVAIVQAGRYFQFLGRVDVSLEKRGDRYRVASVEGRLLPIAGSVARDRETEAIVDRFRPSVEEVIGEAMSHLPDARSSLKPAGRFVVDAVREQTGADVAIVGANNDTTGIAKGPIRVGDLVRLRQYHTPILTVRMTAAQIEAILAKRFYLTSGCSFTRRDTVVSDLSIGGKPARMDTTYLVALTKQVAFRSRREVTGVAYDDTGRDVAGVVERWVRRRAW